MINLKIKGIALDQKTRMPIAILKTAGGDRFIPIWIGPFEASAIIIRMEEVFPPRPLTHDVLANFLNNHGFKVERLEIYDLAPDKSYFARLVYKKGFKRHYMEIRPSDGLALAVRLDVPIVASEKVVSEHPDFPCFYQEKDPAYSEIMFLDMEREHGYMM